MLLPENPEKRSGLWSAAATQLAEVAMCFIIEEGIGNPLREAKKLSQDRVALCLARLREASICRISANRGNPISPHFAGKREDDWVLVTELLTYPSEGVLIVHNEKLKRDLETVVINLFFAERDVNTVLVPLKIVSWTMRDAKISLTREGLVFQKMT